MTKSENIKFKEQEIIESRSYMIEDNDMKRCMNEPVIRELLGNLYTELMKGPEWQRMSQMYQSFRLPERYLLRKHFKRLYREMVETFTFDCRIFEFYSNHELYIKQGAQRSIVYELMGNDERKAYKLEWEKRTAMIYSNTFTDLVRAHPPTQVDLDNMLKRLQYLNYIEHTINEIIQKDCVTDLSMLSLTPAQVGYDKFCEEICGLRLWAEDEMRVFDDNFEPF